MASETVHELNELNFESIVLRAKGPVLVDFTAGWCPPCKALSLVVRSVAEETLGRVVVGCVDVDAFPALAGRFGIRGLPTLVVFNDGKESTRRMGLVDRRAILELLTAPALSPRPGQFFGAGQAIG
jgi:thioredoxin 1